ncbi:phosphotransferase [Actinomadura parmotrematis]|uniref:Aminoglycoside phosphotransferase family protein n=1 Tax=Actinomadura parmotrematis TaxID=2864039 RepID=A0ABS7G3N3_9ACTN|nr:phosphotransferase [Actinomadura parmotrematis]MBW8486970.1 aminoglycoside phosphotransferase family protein [Actinomadura parmotrematis]
MDRRVALTGGRDGGDRTEIRTAAALAADLAGRLGLGRFRGPLTHNAGRPQLVLEFAGGASGEVVLKVYGKRRAGEAQALRHWTRHGIPAATVLDGGDDPATWLLMRRVDGAALAGTGAAAGARLPGLTRELAEVLRAAHASGGTALPGARPLAAVLPGRLRASAAALERHGHVPPAGWRDAAAAYGQGPAVLLHGDLGLGNVLRERAGGLLLLDASAYTGPAAFDAARWCARVGGADAAPAALAAWSAGEAGLDAAQARVLLGLELLLEGGIREIVREQQGRASAAGDRTAAAFVRAAARCLS